MCATLFCAHQFVPDVTDDENYVLAEKIFLEAKKKNTIALTEVKNLAFNTPEYKAYLKINEEKNLAYAKWNNIYKSKEIFGFKSLHHFIERFGLMLCFFIYALYNLTKSYIREPKNIGSKIIHTFIMSVCFFYFFWIFQKFQDFSKATYFLMTLFAGSFTALGVFLITKYKKETINKLRNQLFKVSLTAVRNAKPEKKAETFKMLKDIAADK